MFAQKEKITFAQYTLISLKNSTRGFALENVAGINSRGKNLATMVTFLPAKVRFLTYFILTVEKQMFYFFPEGFSFLSNLKYLQSIPVHRGFTWLYYAKLLFNMKQKKKYFNQLPRPFDFREFVAINCRDILLKTRKKFSHTAIPFRDFSFHYYGSLVII